MRPCASCVTLLLILAGSCLAPAAENDFQPLVHGTDPTQFLLVGIKPETIQIRDDGTIRLTGEPSGYFATKKSYKNYILRFEWMYERPEDLKSDEEFKGNSGLLIHIQEPHKVWPKCVEVQLFNKDAGNTFAINGAKFDGRKDAEAQEKAIKPVGQWNLEEVTCKDGLISCTINGIPVARGVGATPDHGQIGFQSEGAPIQFRGIMIKELD